MLGQRLVITDDQILCLENDTTSGAALLEREFRLRLLRSQLDDIHLIQLLLAGHGHVTGGYTGLVSCYEILQIGDLLLLTIICGLQLGFLHGIDFLELVVIAHIAGQLLIVHVIDEVDDTVQEGNVMADQDKCVLIFIQITLEPFDMFRIQIVGRLIQQQNIGLFQQKFAQQNFGTLTT